MKNPARGAAVTPAALTPAAAARPPMPSITASALGESLRLLALTRRAIAAWLLRG